MLRRLCLSLVLPVLAALAPSIGAAAAMGGQNAPQSLLIRQTAGQQLQAEVGAVGMTNTGYGLTNSTPAATGDLPQFPQLATLATDSQDSVLSKARAWIATHQPGYSQQLGVYMRSYGLSNAWLLYRQIIPVYRAASNDTVQMRLTWTLSQDQAGRASFGDPLLEMIDPADARILHVSYKNRGVAEGLHPAYAFPDGGQVRWQIYTAQGDALGGPGNAGVFNVSGYFDAGLSGEGDVTDSEAVACLVSRSNTGCAGAPVTVQDLLAQTGASLALLDYYWPPETAYGDEAESADCPEGEVTCFSAQGVYNFQSRKLELLECGTKATLTNTGYYGFIVAAEVDRFTIDPVSLISKKLTSYVAPIESAAAETLQIPFSWQLELTPSEALLANSYVIDPIDGSRLLLPSLLGPYLLAPLEQFLECDPLQVAIQEGVSPPSFTAAASGGWGPYTFEWSFSHGEGVTGLSLSSTTGSSVEIQGSATGGNASGICGTVTVTVRDSQLPTAATAASSSNVMGCGLSPQPSVMAAMVRSQLWTEGRTARLNYTVKNSGEIAGYKRDPLFRGFIEDQEVLMGQPYPFTNSYYHVIAISGGTGPYPLPTFRHISGDLFTFSVTDYRETSGNHCGEAYLACYRLPQYIEEFLKSLTLDISLIYGDVRCTNCDTYPPYELEARLPAIGQGKAGWMVTPLAVNPPTASSPREGLYEVEIRDAEGNLLRFPLRIRSEQI